MAGKLEQRNLKMKLDYFNGGVTYQDIADKYGLSIETVQKIALKNNWTADKEQYEKGVEQKVLEHTADVLASKTADINIRHFEAWDKMFGLVNQILDDAPTHLQYPNGLFKVGTIERLAKILEMTQNGQRVAKGLTEAIELQKLALAQQKLELERSKLTGDLEPEVEDDGFIDALKGEAELVWEDEYNGEE